MRTSSWLKLICSTGTELTKQGNDDHVLSTIEDQEGRKLKVRSQYIFGADAVIDSVRYSTMLTDQDTGDTELLMTRVPF